MRDRECRVLLVEDNAVNALLVQKMLKSVESPVFRVTHAESLLKALELSSGHFDAALVDLDLPDSHGLDTFLAIQRSAPGLAIVVLSGCESDDIALQAGFKSSLQFADGQFPVQPKLGAIANGSTALPVGKIETKKWFLPQLGARWDITAHDQMFFNVQKNMRQFVTYGGGGASPWSLASQPAFDLFRDTAKPETSVTYEAGLRTNRQLNWGAITGFDGDQVLVDQNHPLAGQELFFQVTIAGVRDATQEERDHGHAHGAGGHHH